MIIDTKEEASTLRRTKMFAVIVYVVTVMVTAVFLQLGKTLEILIYVVASLAFLLFYWFQYMMQYTYLYYSDNSKNLIFKFYSMRLFYGKPSAIEISKSNFLKFELETSFFNKKESLVLFQKTDKGVFKYPPISLTLLGKKQKTELKRALFSLER